MSNDSINSGNLVSPDQLGRSDELQSIVKIITDIPTNLSKIRRIFRGESLIEDDEGRSFWIQTVKPRFVKIDFKTGRPIIEDKKMPYKDENGNYEIKRIYVPNDEAIEEVLSLLSFMGINNITPITSLSQEDINADLREFEMALSALLTLKQKEWGIDKELRPAIFIQIKTLISDVRAMARQGQTLKQIASNIQRIEQVTEGSTKYRQVSPYG